MYRHVRIAALGLALVGLSAQAAQAQYKPRYQARPAHGPANGVERAVQAPAREAAALSEELSHWLGGDEPAQPASYRAPAARPTAPVSASAYSQSAPMQVAHRPVQHVSHGTSSVISGGEYFDGEFYEEPGYGGSMYAPYPGMGPTYLGHQGGHFFGGAEYLLVRPHFSDSTAYVTTRATESGSTFNFAEEAVDFDWGYQSNFRTYLGYRLEQCDGEVVFTYWNMNFDRGLPPTAPVPAIASGAVLPEFTYCDNLLNGAETPGDVMVVGSSLNMNLYDVMFAKRLTFGSMPCSTDCGDCGDCGGGDCGGCGDSGCFDPCACPVWDLQWSLGARLADIDRSYQSTIINANGGISGFGSVDADFVGAGPRVGLEGRRFFGTTGKLHAYGRSYGSLLVGQVDQNITRMNAADGIVTNTTNNASLTRTVPVAEIELGLGYRVKPWATISAGWMFQAWWDLGAFEAANCTFIDSDDSNIMSFDGLTIRGEIAF